MRRLSWERTFTLSLALTITRCAGLAFPAQLPLNWTDLSNENGFRVERLIRPTGKFARLTTVPTDVCPTGITLWERAIGAAPARSSLGRLTPPASRSS
jgi:hypothetical protein